MVLTKERSSYKDMNKVTSILIIESLGYKDTNSVIDI